MAIGTTENPVESRRTLIVNYEFPPIGGGAGTATFNIARELVRLGAEVQVLTAGYGDLPAMERIDGVVVRRIPTLRRRKDRSNVLEMMIFMIAGMLWAVPIARRFRPAAVITFFGIPCGPIGYVLKKLLRIPYIVSLRGGDVPGYLPANLSTYHRLTAPISRIVWGAAAAIIANSDGLANLARTFMRECPIGVINNGVDTQVFSPGKDTMSASIIRVLTVGRLHHQKAIDVLLRAFAELPDQIRSGSELLIVGDGPERHNLAALAAGLGIGEKVHFLGWVDRNNLPKIYRSAEIFAFPSRDEGMPNAVLEAMASGLPVIASSVSGIAELVTPDVTGLIIPIEDQAALAQALEKLISDGHQREEMGKAGRDKVETAFSWHTAASAYLSLIRTFVETGK